MIDNNEYDDVFCVGTSEISNEIQCQVGGIVTTVIIDSGSKYNIMDCKTWHKLKAKNIQTIKREKKNHKIFKAFGGQVLTMLGVCEAVIAINGRQVIAAFYVVDRGEKFLLGRDTATALRVLKIGEAIDHFDVKGAPKQLSKMKGIMVEIPLKADVKPVMQPYRRIPAAIQMKVDTKINELLAQGIIERVNGPSKWISPMVPVA
ncbi:uncharacterized protein LOC118736085 [Rhagoletis pomonella]|uniref:uncharacterized protein LOC118736085 n=1 Tax=Rhagoletis pomonella TaxID=28610 RepID=UPI00177ABF74|nr:uncharacterized protein LOC118736085 [Rhagoletis pomonella]